MSKSNVFLQSGTIEELPATGFHKIVDKLQVQEKLSKSHKIFIKVNLCAGSVIGPETGANVSAKLAFKLVEHIRSLNSSTEIFIGESDSVGFGFAHDKFRFLGYNDLLSADSKLHLIDLTRSPYVKIQGNKYLNQFMLPEIALSSDFIISLSKIKTHNITRITGGMKNHFGTLPHQYKNSFHPFLNNVLTAINQEIYTDLSILDGNPAMEGNGPVRGKARAMDLTILGNNIVSTDAVMAHLMGFNPNKIRFLQIASHAGLGAIDLDNIDIFGESIESTRQKFEFVTLKKQGLMKSALGIQAIGEYVKEGGHLLHLIDAITDLQRLRSYLHKRMAK